MRLLGEIGDGSISPAEVMVLGDSSTDISLFELFQHNVLVDNPNLPAGQKPLMEKVARYASEHTFGEGFAEVVFHLLKARPGSG